MTELTCFKSYDVRGEIGVNIDRDIVYRIGRAVAQHFTAKSVVIGFDARETSSTFAASAARGILDAGSNVLDIGMAGTEEMYWAVTEFGADAGIEITASHNPINYNGLKMVKCGSQPLDQVWTFGDKSLAEARSWCNVLHKGILRDISIEARKKYVEQLLTFVDVAEFKPLKIVINSGNGAAGSTVDAIIDTIGKRGSKMEFIRVHHLQTVPSLMEFRPHTTRKSCCNQM